jgi:hypothetical protein
VLLRAYQGDTVAVTSAQGTALFKIKALAAGEVTFHAWAGVELIADKTVNLAILD